jgi:hypothetical protein
VAVLPARDFSSVPGDENGLGELLGKLEELRFALVVLEATGVFERLAAVLVGARHNSRIKRFYERLFASGKPRKVALVARM